MHTELSYNEAERLDLLNRYHILDTLPEQAFDDITQLAAYLCKTPIALITLIDKSRQWFKSKVGLAFNEIPITDSFCVYTMQQPYEMFLVSDTHADSRFNQSRLVVGAPFARFYAGVPLVSAYGQVLGSLCVIDTQPRELDANVKSSMFGLARQVMAQLELRKMVFDAQHSVDKTPQSTHELTVQALTDPLTHLNNRLALERCLTSEWERAFRYSQPLSLLKVDADAFQTYNDSYGAAAGDEVLKQLAEIISREARQPDFVARYSDEEFVILLPETDSDGASKIAERIRIKVERASWPHRAITVSIGQASYGNQADADALFFQAEQALGRAKQAGRNCVMTAD